MWHTINLVLWFAMVGATIAPGMPDHVAKWTAVAGLVVAAFWQHSAVRGFFKHRKDNAAGVPTAR